MEAWRRWFPTYALKNVSYLSFGKLFSYGAGFLYGVLAARILGASGYGRLVLIMAAVRFGSLAVNFSLGSPVLTRIKERLAGETDRRVRDTVRGAMVLQGVGAFLFGVVFLAFLWFAAPWFELLYDWQTALGLFALAEVLQLQRKHVDAVLKAFEEYGCSATYSVWGSLGRDFLTVSLMPWWGVEGACLGYLVAEVAIYLFLGAVVVWTWGEKFWQALVDRNFPWRQTMVELYQYGRSNYLSNLIARVYRELSHVLVGGATGTSGVGYYNIALKFKQIFNVIVEPLRDYLFPRLVEKWTRRRSEFFYTLRKYFYQLGPTFLVLAMVLGLSTPWLIPAVWGPGFMPTVPLVWIMLPPFVAQALFRIFREMTFVVRHQRSLVINAVVELVVGLPAAILLIRWFGTVGAAWALTVKIVAMVAYQVWFFQNQFGRRWIWPDN